MSFPVGPLPRPTCQLTRAGTAVWFPGDGTGRRGVLVGSQAGRVSLLGREERRGSGSQDPVG